MRKSGRRCGPYAHEQPDRYQRYRSQRSGSPPWSIHRTQDATINVEGGRHLAKYIKGARYIELPGTDHIPFVGESAGEIADAIEEFLTGSRAPVPIDRVLATYRTPQPQQAS
jgi:pimeloyl-ACP methyl ester carboxylesterase